MKKLCALVCLAMLLALSACGGGDPTLTRLGTSELYLAIPEGFTSEADDFGEDQVAFYYKDEDSIDFDVYQWAKEGLYTLASEAEYFAQQYDAVPEAVSYNGLSGMKYISLEEYDGYEYTVLNYMFEDEENIVELCFWTIDTPEELAAVEAIISTITTQQ